MPTLASNFIDQDDDNHQSSHWQIGNDCSFSEIIYDRWRNSENWYNNINTQAEDDLTDEVADVLLENSDYPEMHVLEVEDEVMIKTCQVFGLYIYIYIYIYYSFPEHSRIYFVMEV